MGWYRAVALDLDGTLTTGGWPHSGVLEAIAAWRADGVQMLLVTGRILADLEVEFPGLADRFDMVVAENGCVIRTTDWTRTLADPVDPALLERLHTAGVAVRRGRVLLATDADARHAVLDAVEALGLDVHLMRNRSAMMLIPPGITKGTGLQQALAELGVSRHNTLAVGDAENDHALLAAAGLGVAVGNAVDSLRRHADLVLAAANGAGVIDLLTGPVMDGRQRIHPPRWRIVVGTDAAGRPATLPAAQTNLLITGDSESGKSYLAGLVIEQLVALGYSLLVVDPEGDHVSLGALRGVTVLAGTKLPDPAELPSLYGDGVRSLVLDLSRLHPDIRDHYLDGLWGSMSRHRAETGMPHWVVLEEAQNLRSCRSPHGPTNSPWDWGLCLVSYQPYQIAPDLLARMEWRVELSPGGRNAILTPPTGTPYPFTVGRRTTRHVRHWRKYVDSQLPRELWFVFRDNSAATGLVAGNLREFVTALQTVPAAVIAHHARNGDFSHWVGAVYRDHVAAALVATTEHDLIAHADPERTRRLLTELIAFRYLPPDPPPSLSGPQTS